MRQQQWEAQQAQAAAMEQARQGAIIPGGVAEGPPEASGALPMTAPGFDFARYAQNLGPIAPEKSLALQQALGTKAKKLKDTKTLMQNGRRVTVNIYDDGTHEILPFDPDAEKLHFAGTGGRVGVGFEPYTGAVASPGVPATQDPNSVASVGATLRGQNMTDARMREQNQIAQGTAATGRTADLRKEFNALPQVKAYGEVQPGLQSAREAMGTDTAAADLNLIYAAAKIFDPTSVVRESETSMVIASGSPAQRFLGQFNYVAGGGRLTPEARKSLMAEIESRGRGYESGYKSARKAYTAVATKQGIDPADVFVEPFAPSAPAASVAPKVTNDAEFAALPSGTVFVGPDGKKRRKP